MKKQKEIPWIEVVNGPSREDVRDAIGAKPDRRFNLVFKLQIDDEVLKYLHEGQMGFGCETGVVELEVVLYGLEWELGTDHFGEEFRLQGLALTKCGTPFGIHPRFSTIYRTDVRKGEMQIGWPEPQ